MADLNYQGVVDGQPGPASSDQHVAASIARINWEFFHPRPLQSSNWHRRRFAERYVGSAARVMGRELQQEEIDAIVDHFSRGTRAEKVYSLPASFACTYYFWNRGISTYRFPFLGPRPVPRFLAALTSPVVAHWMWQAVRLLSYDLLCDIAVGTPVGRLAFSYASAGSLNDPRLAQLRQEHERRRHEMRDQLMQQVARRRPGGAGPDGLGGPQRPRALPDHDNDYAQAPEESTQSDGWQSAETQSAAQTAPAQTRPMRPTWPRASPAPPPPSQQPQSSFDEDDPFDDASPVAPDWRDQPPPQRSSGRPGESAWDRLRRQAQSKDQNPAQSSWEARRQTPGSQSQTDQDWTYKSDEDSQSETERERAQREFDAMLERERRAEQSGRRR
ncbi:hypothetical protein PpBr36_07084 [Pyricularia pennisetigena]|uniref:hypothetical protein n=1 Tax=Pyricularia pennisetigena TaxID=1578925 RepID=UPI0011526608|nr:hypothetical protein PpBr36_07084 [Pyricularia pennisetigena]TLS25873.1 hypothetical protein PpBr36_07084 [Pyricularia pennisetigena]